MKKTILSISAIMLVLALAFGVSAFKNDHSKKAFTQYYYEFSGTHGQESDMSLWIQLPSQTDYNNFSCNPGSNNSCKIINTTNSGGHPTAVPLDASGFPQIGTVNLDRKLKQ